MKKAKKRPAAVIKQIILIVMTLIMFFPLYIVFVMGTYYSDDIFKGLPILPSDYFLTNLKLVISKGYFSAYFNSIYGIRSICNSECTGIYHDRFCTCKIQFQR